MQKPKLKKIKQSDKQQRGPTAAIIDAAILRCWEFEATRWQEQKAYFRGSHAVASSIDKTYFFKTMFPFIFNLIWPAWGDIRGS